MAVMEPVSSLSQFLSVLTELRLGQRARYPFYCALLYTTAKGMDAALGRYVDRNWEELDAMTGETCLVFVLGDLRNEPAAGDRPFSSREVYRVAEHLGVRASALPCAAFFARPDHSREVLRVRISDYLGPQAPDADERTLTRAFRGMSAAIARCARLSAADRIDCLRAELIREQRESFPVAAPPPGQGLASAASTVDSVEKVIVGGTTIAATVLRVLGIGI
jgi:hypothetical protein